MAYASRRPQTTAQEVYGIYDLTEPRSLRAFATFLLDLREDLLSMASICAARVKVLSSEVDPGVLHLWRSDGALTLSPDDLVLRDGVDDHAMHEGQEDCLERAVRVWCEDVYKCCDA